MPTTTDEAATMTPYANLSGASPIEAYRTGDGWIEVRFRRQGRTPARTYRFEGAEVVSLTELALTGSGLATYVARQRPDYAARW